MKIPIGAEVVESDTISKTTNTYLYENAQVKKYGKVVCLNLYGLKNITNRTSTLIMTLDSKYRPSSNKGFPVIGSGLVDVPESFKISILTDGSVYVYAYNGVSTINNLEPTLTYII